MILLGSVAAESVALADMCGGGGGDDVVEPDADGDAGGDGGSGDAGHDAQAARKRRTRQVAGGLGLVAGLGAVWLIARSRGGGTGAA